MPCGAAKLPGAVASGAAPAREHLAVLVEHAARGRSAGRSIGPWRCEVWPVCHQSSDTCARPGRVEHDVRRAAACRSTPLRYSPSGLKIWMRSFSRSHTKTRPSVATAMPCGRWNWPGPLPGLAPRPLQRAGRRELVHAAVAVAVGDVEIALRADGEVGRAVERARRARDRRSSPCRRSRCPRACSCVPSVISSLPSGVNFRTVWLPSSVQYTVSRPGRR